MPYPMSKTRLEHKELETLRGNDLCVMSSADASASPASHTTAGVPVSGGGGSGEFMSMKCNSYLFEMLFRTHELDDIRRGAEAAVKMSDNDVTPSLTISVCLYM